MQNKFKYTKENLEAIINDDLDAIDYERKSYSMLPSVEKSQQLVQNRIVVKKNGTFIVQDGQLVPYTPLSRQQRGLRPSFCPVCGRIFGFNKFDGTFWKIYGMCIDCGQQLQMVIKQKGLWKKFQMIQSLRKQNYHCDQALQFYQQMLKDAESHQQLQFVNDDGDVQVWSNQNRESYINNINRLIDQLYSYKTQILQKMEQFFVDYKSLKDQFTTNKKNKKK